MLSATLANTFRIDIPLSGCVLPMPFPSGFTMMPFRSLLLDSCEVDSLLLGLSPCNDVRTMLVEVPSERNALKI